MTTMALDKLKVKISRALEIKIQQKKLEKELGTLKEEIAEYLGKKEAIGVDGLGVVYWKLGKVTFCFRGSELHIKQTKLKLVQQNLGEFKRGEDYLEFKITKIS